MRISVEIPDNFHPCVFESAGYSGQTQKCLHSKFCVETAFFARAVVCLTHHEISYRKTVTGSPQCRSMVLPFHLCTWKLRVFFNVHMRGMGVGLFVLLLISCNTHFFSRASNEHTTFYTLIRQDRLGIFDEDSMMSLDTPPR